jgi:hypothetical protein
MTNQHPITPPPELFAKCYEQAERQLQSGFSPKFAMSHAIRTAYDAGHAAGADQKLEACCKTLELSDPNATGFLYSARRPEPPSLKEKGLNALAKLKAQGLCSELADEIRRALEALPE